MWKMFQAGDAVLVGVSGGADSVALLHILRTLAPEFSLRLGIAHLNHCLRFPDADKDAEFVTSLAIKLNLPYYISKADVKMYQQQHRLSLEDAARRLRYAFFEDTAAKHGFSKIALGHHADDNAESVLMYLLRGSGLTGVSGIPPNRDGKFVRPLMDLTKAELIEFMNKNSIAYISDASNADKKFLRNRIRHGLIPLLKKYYNPNIAETLSRFSAIVRCEDEWIESEIIAPLFAKCVSASENDMLALSAPMLEKMNPAAQRRIIRKAIATVKGDARRISYSHIEAVVNLLHKSGIRKHLDLPDGIRAERNGDILVFSKYEQAKAEIPYFEYSLSAPGTIFIKETGMYLRFSCAEIRRLQDCPAFSPTVAYFDTDALTFPMVVRQFRPGDRFCPLGMTGTQKVKDFFINSKVPANERKKCPIVLSGGKIIWIAGYRTDESAKIRSSTANILKAELFLA
jgi:tRNA(Ile)-lysidine synthase